MAAVAAAEAAAFAGSLEEDCGDEAPKIFANRASLYTQMAMFTLVVVRNLAVPGVTVEKGWFRTVEVTVSMALAVR